MHNRFIFLKVFRNNLSKRCHRPQPLQSKRRCPFITFYIATLSPCRSKNPQSCRSTTFLLLAKTGMFSQSCETAATTTLWKTRKAVFCPVKIPNSLLCEDTVLHKPHRIKSHSQKESRFLQESVKPGQENSLSKLHFCQDSLPWQQSPNEERGGLTGSQEPETSGKIKSKAHRRFCKLCIKARDNARVKCFLGTNISKARGTSQLDKLACKDHPQSPPPIW